VLKLLKLTRPWDRAKVLQFRPSFSFFQPRLWWRIYFDWPTHIHFTSLSLSFRRLIYELRRLISWRASTTPRPLWLVFSLIIPYGHSLDWSWSCLRSRCLWGSMILCSCLRGSFGRALQATVEVSPSPFHKTSYILCVVWRRSYLCLLLPSRSGLIGRQLVRQTRNTDQRAWIWCRQTSPTDLWA
jgi:hypothetical protein